LPGPQPPGGLLSVRVGAGVDGDGGARGSQPGCELGEPAAAASVGGSAWMEMDRGDMVGGRNMSPVVWG
jgi:hypothetical protein